MPAEGLQAQVLTALGLQDSTGWCRAWRGWAGRGSFLLSGQDPAPSRLVEIDKSAAPLGDRTVEMTHPRWREEGNKKQAGLGGGGTGGGKDKRGGVNRMPEE